LVGERAHGFSRLCAPYMANDAGLASAAKSVSAYFRGRKAHDASVMGRKRTLRVNLHPSPAASGKTLLNNC
jgi:hypothetical protein